ncbi:PREDICTED: uncharacterized protein LOC108750264 [Trachymyrmex septentrionalis]|uniref:uncharacterized protein LOC108750264 n=1 Tax=Trachymyrmex septentrionalis TaxID=34720 RepID=UPI00084EF444|nr:PREDICTED: uncharacterized protein LOC108750264 [Trachymyrmex septentrionalis]
MQSEADLTEALNLVIWNKRFMSFLGLWPLKPNHLLFIFFTIYMIIYCIMGAGHLIKNFNQPEVILANLTDNVLFGMILGKMFICKHNCKIMIEFLKSIEIDFTTKMYDNVQEKMAYLYYNKIALLFVKISTSMAGIAATMYYLRTFFENWSASKYDHYIFSRVRLKAIFHDNGLKNIIYRSLSIVSLNHYLLFQSGIRWKIKCNVMYIVVSGNFSYKLPYPVHPFFEIKDAPTYICMCVYLALAIAIIVCGYAGPDAFVLSMALHVCGQFAVLSCKVNHLLRDNENYHRHISNIVLRHYHLIRLAETLESNFNIIYLQQTLGTLLLLCFTVYHMISTSTYGDETTVLAFALYVSCVISTILAYCYIGECLIVESTALREAFYNSDWYNNPPSTSKLINICMVRSEKPLMLTAGKFCVLSLNTFTSDQKDLDRAAKVLSWNKWLMSMLGLWPFQSNDLIFSISFVYFSFLLVLEYLSFFLYIGDLELVIMNLTENVAFLQIFVRMSTLRLYNDEIGEVITEAMKDFDETNYKTAEEIKTFVTYYAKSRIFFKLMMVFVTITASSYYLTPILIILGNGGLPEIVTNENVTQIIYLLPYRFHVFYAIENIRTYTITYVWQMPFAFVSACGQSTADCIMVTLVYHICGQMSVLALRINNIDTEVCDCGPEMRHMMLMHVRLLRMGKIIGKAFSATLLVHLLGATSLVSILGYQMLSSLSKGETGVVPLLLKFFLFIFLVLLILYAHCLVGENLLTESAKVGEAFYNCRWYDMSKNNARMLVLCMVRSQKPLCLIAGKFTMFCLSTLTDVLKTSMGYLSVLRSLL